MKDASARRTLVRGRAALLAVAALALAASPTRAQQVPDTTFDTRIADPAWPAGTGPRLVLDEAHHNFHTLTGRYRPFGDLARHDGFRVSAGTSPFTRARLDSCDLLVISNALGVDDMADSAAMHAAFTDAEIAAVVRWVEAGGALLLIADHAPMGAAATSLGRALGVDMRSAYTLDPLFGMRGAITQVDFAPGHGLDTTHAIVRGRSSDERVRLVRSFTGQSLTGPPGAATILALSDSSLDAMVTFAERDLIGRGLPRERMKSAAGRAQGLAFARGRGRVVVLGEAAMMSAQRAGPDGSFLMGMNVPGIDNRQFAINVLRWLARRLP